jgi:hypothetical protein
LRDVAHLTTDQLKFDLHSSWLIVTTLAQGEKGLMAKGPAIMLNFTPYLNIVVIHLNIMSGFEYTVAKCNSMA